VGVGVLRNFIPLKTRVFSASLANGSEFARNGKNRKNGGPGILRSQLLAFYFSNLQLQSVTNNELQFGFES
jgi:hypothetical protein